ncbi:MAG: protein-L-isoaspartate(D-aspartate) O-methyltransferase [Planctomycetes bacterium]|nr:protein-L-isoaspartate(D-aspartate) O-methyltransferase [Planctomycetota bacterium]
MNLLRPAFLCLVCTAAFLPGGCSPRTRTAVPAGDWTTQRKEMVEEQLVPRGIRNERVLEVMAKVPRQEFVPQSVRDLAYSDGPLPIGEGQTISQPYIVAFMTEAVDPQSDHRVLEVGTGSGYQAAVLAELVGDVYTIEIIPKLAEQATARLNRLGYGNVYVRAGDGYIGWPEAAPFDSILVTCGADHVPQPLFEQLKPGGKLIIPVGPVHDLQWLKVIEKTPSGEMVSRTVLPVRFVPLRREEQAGKD